MRRVVGPFVYQFVCVSVWCTNTSINKIETKLKPKINLFLKGKTKKVLKTGAKLFLDTAASLSFSPLIRCKPFPTNYATSWWPIHPPINQMPGVIYLPKADCGCMCGDNLFNFWQQQSSVLPNIPSTVFHVCWLYVCVCWLNLLERILIWKLPTFRQPPFFHCSIDTGYLSDPTSTDVAFMLSYFDVDYHSVYFMFYFHANPFFYKHIGDNPFWYFGIFVFIFIFCFSFNSVSCLNFNRMRIA